VNAKSPLYSCGISRVVQGPSRAIGIRKVGVQLGQWQRGALRALSLYLSSSPPVRNKATYWFFTPKLTYRGLASSLSLPLGIISDRGDEDKQRDNLTPDISLGALIEALTSYKLTCARGR